MTKSTVVHKSAFGIIRQMKYDVGHHQGHNQHITLKAHSAERYVYGTCAKSIIEMEKYKETRRIYETVI